LATAAPYVFAKRPSGFDPILARQQLGVFQMLIKTYGVAAICENLTMILAKKSLRSRGRLIPFKFSKIQQEMENKKGKKNITLKPRQIGSTTWHIITRLFLPAIREPGTSGLLISQTKPYGAQHFQILQRALKNFCAAPSWLEGAVSEQTLYYAREVQENLLHTQFSARHELKFDFLDSKILVDTAENPDAGTGLTIHHLVATEVAYWKRDPESLLAQAKEAIPDNGTMDLESTPNGMGGYFYEEWQRALLPNSEFVSHFYPWWYQEEYVLDPPADEDTLTEEEEKMAEEYEWTMKQISWRRGKIVALRHKFPEKYPEDAQTCFLTSGDTFFDRDTLRWMKLRADGEKPLESFHDGSIRIFKRRIKGRRYVIGADVAEGKLVAADNSDFSAACVMDIDTGEEVASYRSKQPPEEFAQDLVDLAEQYNMAMIAPERNGPGGNVILTLNRLLLYGNIYMHKEWVQERKQVIPKAGFPTNQRTRPIALNKLAAMVRDAPEFWHDKTFIDEALNFVWTSKNRATRGVMTPGGISAVVLGPRIPQGAPGCHDDTVLARAITAYVRLVLLGYLDPIEVPSERYGNLGSDEEADEAA
jgi:hypothetical protein